MRPWQAVPMVAWLVACRDTTAEADDVCMVERLPDAAEPSVWTIGAQIGLPEGGSMHVQARWPEDGPAGSWPVAVVVHGAWNQSGTPVASDTVRPDVRAGVVGVHLDLPGGGLTDGENDRRGAASRAAVATALRWAAGLEPDLGGCTLADRAPNADASRVFLLGTSNGGNLAVATLADATLEAPASGLILWETPSAAQFTNVELGVDPSVYTPGSCVLDAVDGVVCTIPADSLRAGSVDDREALCFDLDGDDACGEADVDVLGTQDPASGITYVSPLLTEAAAARGLLPAGFGDAESARSWWLERDASRLAASLVEARPDLPVMLLASEVDHVQSLADHPHVFGLGEALQAAGVAWVRLNPGHDWLPRDTEENPPGLPLRLDAPVGVLVEEAVEQEALLAAAVFELGDRVSSDDW